MPTYHLATFSTDVTPPLGHPLCGGWIEPVRGVEDIKLAPFHILASEGAAHADKTHVWHMETLAELCKADPELPPHPA